MKEGSRTPWGKADFVEEKAPGIWIIGTPSHGGVKLSAARNRQVPADARCEGGWYEEDCEALVPLLVFHTEMQARSTREALARSLRTYFPTKVAALVAAGFAPAEPEAPTDRVVEGRETNVPSIA